MKSHESPEGGRSCFLWSDNKTFRQTLAAFVGRPNFKMAGIIAWILKTKPNFDFDVVDLIVDFLKITRKTIS